MNYVAIMGQFIVIFLCFCIVAEGTLCGMLIATTVDPVRFRIWRRNIAIAIFAVANVTALVVLAGVVIHYCGRIFL